jgi:hypothetical protein
MTGIFRPSKDLPINVKKLYRSIYCSLCKTLKDRYGIFYTVFISHEIVQLIIAILQYCSLSISEIKCINCIKQKRKKIVYSEVFDTAVDCCLLLCWIKLIDARMDKEHLLFRIWVNIFTPKIKTIKSHFSKEMQAVLEEYIEAIKHDANYILIIELTGKVAELIFKEILTKTKISLEDELEILPIGYYYGKIIALSDPLIDYDKDLKRGKKNPIMDSSMSYFQNKLKEVIFDSDIFIEKMANNRKITKYLYTCFAFSTINTMKKINKI